MMKYFSTIQKNKGFTLIEVVMYSGIVVVFITFAILTAHQMIQYSDRIEKSRELNENQRFLVQKLQWVLSNSQVINSPAVGASSTSISINKLNSAQNPFVVDSSKGIVRLSMAGGAPVALTNFRFASTSIRFEHIQFSNQYAIRVTGSLMNDVATASLDTMIYIK